MKQKLFLLSFIAFNMQMSNAKCFDDFKVNQGEKIIVNIDTTSAPVLGTTFNILKNDFKTVLNADLVIGKKAKIVVRHQPVENKSEGFHIYVNDGALYIDGSDYRGMAYGMLELSKLMGVSPWEWWADVPSKSLPSFSLKSDMNITEFPSVRFRGIFINDEDWGLKTWSQKTMKLI